MSCLIDCSIKAAFFLLFAILLSACELDPSDNVGGSLNPLDGNVGVLFTDTLTVQSSTVLVDSVVTTNSSTLWVGRYADPAQGKAETRSFFQVFPEGRFDLGPSIQVDSTRFFLYYDSVGTGAVTQQLRLHRLTDEISPSRDYRSSEQIGFETNPVGEFLFSRPANRRGRIDTLFFRIDVSVGRELINAYTNTLTRNDFVKAFRGFALATGTQSSGLSEFRTLSIPNSNGQSFAVAGVRVHYRNGSDTTKRTIRFVIDNQLLSSNLTSKFNQLAHDRSGTPLAPLRRAYDELPASATNEQVYIQSGVGLATKLVIPHFNRIYRNRNVVINDAKLIIDPLVGNAFSDAQARPFNLTLYEVGTNGRIPTGTIQGLPADWLAYIPLSQALGAPASERGVLRSDGKYVFNITDYLQRLVVNEQQPANQRRPDRGLFVAVPSGSPFGANENRLEGLVFGSQRHPSKPLKLLVYYTFVNSN
ncbi:MAG: DUF4270 domain-containing protein [Cytophagales bacterium]|nr:DUF4270 domain-containing protein [Cytophagales bacterium]